MKVWGSAVMPTLVANASVVLWPLCFSRSRGAVRLVDKVNEAIGQDENCSMMIGVLDIYGFESFEVNR